MQATAESVSPHTSSHIALSSSLYKIFRIPLSLCTRVETSGTGISEQESLMQSLCVQLLIPQPGWVHLAKLISSPVHTTSTNQKLRVSYP